MKINNIKEYFRTFILIKSALRKLNEQLTQTEIDFLISCCVYNFNGGDLNNFDSLFKYLNKETLFIRRRNDLSTYKLKLSIKKWVKSSRDVFKLIHSLDIVKDGNSYSQFSRGERVRLDRVGFNILVELEENEKND